ncbi:hypothetical protein TNCV_4693851 [Trichonephila clavipes]|uniref:Uncharacterized protein n=1 Tax=Trichonephila clavipes TaxID=2585209 RepID=A0A8X6WCE7_TRICX|nr:hypothetical protein TNCV_4693851 [Trichonephila clavipes]
MRRGHNKEDRFDPEEAGKNNITDRRAKKVKQQEYQKQKFNILKDNWGRWKQHSRTLIGSFMARMKPRVLTLGQS